jgi:KEOPS complex subunit Cgi121
MNSSRPSSSSGERMADPVCDIYQAIGTIEDPARFLIRIREIADACDVHIIFFDAERLAGREHAKTALAHAWRSWTGGEPIANSLEMEALLYAAGTRQCLVASTFGIHRGENRSYIAVCPPRPAVRDLLADLVTFVEEDWERIDRERQRRLADLFGITPEEIAVVGEARFRELVLERVALLEVYR